MENTIRIGETEINSIMVGDMGIKSVYAGDSHIFERTGGYIYLELSSNKEED